MSNENIFGTLPNDWKNHFDEYFSSIESIELSHFVNEAYRNDDIFPPKQQVFEAFKLCAFEKVKVVIIGQDPYHGVGQAHGLCFSVNENQAIPPSLKNIFKEKMSDLGETFYPISGNLSSWASQGVLLLNTILTVKSAEANSHKNKGWETFTDTVISTISKEKQSIVFLLWGANAKKKSSLIDSNKHLILTANHPSPLSANRGGWFGCKHFSRTNHYLQKHNISIVEW
ncbi:MAG: uracil-DNA glycosylase [Pseudarcicella sp.]|nr:uracil-DNA glycosylase [Pseudarcicella sp.]